MRKKIDVSRRDFLKGSLVVGGTGLALGIAGCAPKVGTPTPEATQAPAVSTESINHIRLPICMLIVSRR